MKSLHSWNRRDVITKPFAWLAASRLFGGFDFLFAQSTEKSVQAAPVIYRTLGNTGLRLPIVSMGVMNASIPGVVRRAYEIGMRHFDTAAGYQQGRNEEMLGKVIKELGTRDQVVIATKAFIPPTLRRTRAAEEQIRKIFEGSLARLQMDHVDILYYHAVDSADEAGLEGPLAALTKLKKEGKTRFIGISTHASQAILDEAVKLGVYDVALITINYTMASDKGLLGAIDRASKKGIGLVAMKTQAGGLVRPDPKLPKNLPTHSQSALLKWVLQNESIATAIPGFTTFEQLEQNFAVARNLQYTEPERQFLSNKDSVAQAEFCVQCGKCRPDCPLGVEIPTMMRSHMYAVQYANHDLAYATLRGIGAGKGLDACRDCASCRAVCRGNVNIARKIMDLKNLTSPTVTTVA